MKVSRRADLVGVEMREDPWVPRINEIFEDAWRKLQADGGANLIRVKGIKRGYFSTIYEISIGDDRGAQRYMLKISDPSRSCVREYEAYRYLREKGIRSLDPVAYSESYNYLITRKEDLTSFERLLTQVKSEGQVAEWFRKIGLVLRELVIAEEVRFESGEYAAYMFPRIERSDGFAKKDKKLVKKRIEGLLKQIEGTPGKGSFVSDLSFGNIHFDSKMEPVILDLGDAGTDDCYQNISQIYVNLKFGVLSRYVERSKRTEELFRAFLDGYGFKSLSVEKFVLFQCKNLINMVEFTLRERGFSKGFLEKMQLSYYLYRYRKYILEILRAE